MTMRARGPTSFGVLMGLVLSVLVAGLAAPYLRADTPQSIVAPGAAAPGRRSASAERSAEDRTAPAGDAQTGGPAGATKTSAAGRATPGAGGAGGATDVGVTANEVRVGIPITDIGAAASFGFNFDIGDQPARWQALITHLNKAGGIHGRKIAPHFRTIVSGTPEEDSQAACIAWTKDIKVFSVLESSGLSTAGTVCITAQGATPLIRTDGLDEAYYRTEYLFSMQGTDNRILGDHARYLHGKRKLQGKTIGILAEEGSERLAIDNTLVPTLNRLGYEVATVEEVPGGAPGAQRSSVAISNFRAAGVDFVIVAAGVVIAGPFAQSADRAGYRPEFALSSFNNQVNDQTGNFFPESFEGTIALTTMRFPEHRAGFIAPADKACFDRVASADPKVNTRSSAAREVALRECAVFDAWVAAVLKAGPALDRAALVSALERSGRFGIAGVQDGHFGPGRHDAVAFEREVAWHRACECWELAGGLTASVRAIE